VLSRRRDVHTVLEFPRPTTKAPINDLRGQVADRCFALECGIDMETHLRRRRAAAILFSLIAACLFGLSGLLAGWYLWDHFGPLARDPDDTEGYFCGLLVGGAMAIGGGVTLLSKFWPRSQQQHRNRAEPKRQGLVNEIRGNLGPGTRESFRFGVTERPKVQQLDRNPLAVRP